MLARSPRRTVPRAPGRPISLLDAGTVFVIAFVLRVGVVLLSRGGPRGIFGYDAGVYYAAADAFVHGRLPYRDFVLLHPPGVLLAVSPFAGLGRLTTDHTGFIVANTAFELLGALNAVLVGLVARRVGCRRSAALLGALFYAVWLGAVNAEIGVRLEPLGSTLFLLALLALTGGALDRRRAVLAGVALAAACSVKIWWIVPAAVVLGWHLCHRDRRPAVTWMVAGGAGLALVLDGAFFAAAPGTMWRMVVTDQLGRQPVTGPELRVAEVTGLHFAFPALAGPAEIPLLVILAGLVVAAGAAAWRLPPARMVVLVLAAQLLVLAGSPSYFAFYAGFVAATLGLTLAAAAETRPARAGRRGFPVAAVTAVTAAAFTGIALLRPITVVSPFPAQRLAGAARSVRCLMSDSPAALIELNTLSRDLAAGCPNWVDVTGRTYGADAPPGGLAERRAQNRRWQADLRHYLFSGGGFIVVRASGTGLSRTTRRALAGHRVLAVAGRYVLYRTVPR